MHALNTKIISGVRTPVIGMAGVVGSVLDIPSDGEYAIVRGFIYEWTVVEDLGVYERWGWELYGPACDAKALGVPADTPCYNALPLFE